MNKLDNIDILIESRIVFTKMSPEKNKENSYTTRKTVVVRKFLCMLMLQVRTRLTTECMKIAWYFFLLIPLLLILDFHDSLQRLWYIVTCISTCIAEKYKQDLAVTADMSYMLVLHKLILTFINILWALWSHVWYF